ncbi:MAG: MFS transporter [Dehalococcoidia bacterium]|nr:MFS transporter [Dehalococcoidia bacterium]MSQ15983.1 MFS transporter [Dehalococcoidia bacterium]
MAQSDAQPQETAPAAGAAAPQIPPHPATRRGMKTFTSLQNNRDYRFLFAGNLCANAAQWLQLLTVGWLVLEISGGSALHAGSVVGLRALPTLVLGPYAGVLADRYNRKRIAIACQLALAVAASIFAAVVATGDVTVWHAYVYMAIVGVGFTIKQPVRQALIANTVQKSDMPNALALNAMAVTSMRLVGPLIGGILIATVGFKWNFVFEACLFLSMALLLLPMRTPFQEGGANRHASGWANMVEGLRYIAKSKVMLRLNLLNFVRAAAFGTVPLVLPAYAKSALDGGPSTGTALLTVMGVGGLSATVIMASWGFFTKKGMVGLISLAAGSACILGLGLSHWLWLSLLLIALQGFFQTHFIVSNQTLIQTLVPDSLRGRVSSVWHYEQGLTPLFVFLVSVLGEYQGMGVAISVLGACSLALSLFFFLRFTDNRTLD